MPRTTSRPARGRVPRLLTDSELRVIHQVDSARNMIADRFQATGLELPPVTDSGRQPPPMRPLWQRIGLVLPLIPAALIALLLLGIHETVVGFARAIRSIVRGLA